MLIRFVVYAAFGETGEPLGTLSMNQIDHLDPIDRRIVSALQDDGTLSNADLAQRVGASSASCWRRVKALEAAGVLTRMVRLVDPAAVGRGVNVLCNVRMRSHAVEARLYDRLFTVENPNEAPEGKDFTVYLNPNSLEVLEGKSEPSLASAKPGDRYQFERLGYFCADKSSTAERLVFNRTVELRDAWAKLQKRM